MTGVQQDEPSRQVSARLVLQVAAPAEVILQLAVAGLAGADGEDELTVRREGRRSPRPSSPCPKAAGRTCCA